MSDRQVEQQGAQEPAAVNSPFEPSGDRPIIAFAYDFDKTLSTEDMQNYAFIPALGKSPSEFWKAANEFSKAHHMDGILAYMYKMLEEAKNSNQPITRELLKSCGEKIVYYPGVEEWFGRMNRYCEERGYQAEHYIISSGIKEIVEGTKIAGEFKRLYAGEFVYDDEGHAIWPAMAVNYTSKMQFLFRVNKGVLDVTEDKALNNYTEDINRRVPFTRIIYFGDGLTDVPCMKVNKMNGGHSIAVYPCDNEQALVNAQGLLLHGRVDFVLPADYTDGSELDKTVKDIVDYIVTDDQLRNLHKRQKACGLARGLNADLAAGLAEG